MPEQRRMEPALLAGDVIASGVTVQNP